MEEAPKGGQQAKGRKQQRGKRAKGAAANAQSDCARSAGLAPRDEIQPGELARRANEVAARETRGEDSDGVLPPTRPDRYLRLEGHSDLG